MSCKTRVRISPPNYGHCAIPVIREFTHTIAPCLLGLAIPAQENKTEECEYGILATALCPFTRLKSGASSPLSRTIRILSKQQKTQPDVSWQSSS